MEVQCTFLTKYTVVNGSTVIVCKLNNVRYCTFKVQCTSLTVVNGSTVYFSHKVHCSQLIICKLIMADTVPSACALHKALVNPSSVI